MIQETLELRAKKTISQFVKEMISLVNLKIKGRYFVTKVLKIQEKLSNHHSNNKVRFELLEIKYK